MHAEMRTGNRRHTTGSQVGPTRSFFFFLLLLVSASSSSFSFLHPLSTSLLLPTLLLSSSLSHPPPRLASRQPTPPELISSAKNIPVHSLPWYLIPLPVATTSLASIHAIDSISPPCVVTNPFNPISSPSDSLHPRSEPPGQDPPVKVVFSL